MDKSQKFLIVGFGFLAVAMFGVFAVTWRAVSLLMETDYKVFDFMKETNKSLISLHERLTSLEGRLEEFPAGKLEELGWGDELLRKQLQAYSDGTYYLHTFSSEEEGIGLCDEAPQDPAVRECGWYGKKPGESLKVVMYTLSTGEVIDEFDVGPIVYAGDYVVAWYAKEEPGADSATPIAGVWRPYFRDPETGLTIAVVRVFTGDEYVP